MQTAIHRFSLDAVLILIISLIVPAYSAAQEGIALGEPDRGVFGRPAAGISGILDPSKLDISHSLSMQYSSSSRPGGGANTLGMYENQMSYQISDPLNLTLYLGYQFEPMVGEESGRGKLNQVLPGFSLTYQPGDNFLMQFSYRKLGARPYNYAGYGGFPHSCGFTPGK